MNRRFFIIFSIIAFIAVSCEKGGNCFENEGAITQEYRLYGQFFKNLETNSDINYYISHGTPSVKIIAGSNLLDLVKTSINETETLKVVNLNTCKWFGKYQALTEAYVKMGEFWQLTVFGTGNIMFTDTVKMPYFKTDLYQSAGVSDYLVDCDKFIWYQHSGVTNMNAKGKARLAIIISDDRGIVDCKQLEAKHAIIESNGTGDFYINASDSLSITSTGAGNIYYSGNPVIYKNEISGEGKLIKL